ncbi:hypothetical protein L596_023252 [Steinernema carpocapsae]|uniref:Uncharacterized protein n=1 Tax=Steinernema carpocapsae TaxID=34508 RepID=A0A4U5MD32_STECR|nr:hypothetical protein L596_023252 [Steinernema carpocapsae]
MIIYRKTNRIWPFTANRSGYNPCSYKVVMVYSFPSAIAMNKTITGFTLPFSFPHVLIAAALIPGVFLQSTDPYLRMFDIQKIPNYLKVLTLFIEQPAIDFLASLSIEEMAALGKARTDAKVSNLTDQQYAEDIGSGSKSAEKKFLAMLKQINNMTNDFDKTTREALLQINHITEAMEETPTEESVEQWIVDVVSLLRSLSPQDQATVEKDLPHLGGIMKSTNFLQVKTTQEASKLIDELAKQFDKTNSK